MPLYEIRAIGVAAGQQIINSWWYSTPEPEGATQTGVQAVLNSWTTNVQPSFLAWALTAYTLTQRMAQGYAHDFTRSPYLPIIEDVSLAGSTATAQAPAVVAAVLSARVEPIQPGHQRDPDTGLFVLRPVRRGYWSFGPVGITHLLPTGEFASSTLTSTQWTNLRTACLATIPVAGFAQSPRPIRVSKLPKGATVRGWGNVVGTIWRPRVSTRRSRRTGIGA